MVYMTGLGWTSAAKLLLFIALSAPVCLGQHFSDSPQHAAKAMTVEGRVSVLRNLREWAISVGDPIQPKETVVTGIDGHAVFQVADGSHFEVFPNAKVVFRNSPPNWRDLLDVLAGKVRIYVQHKDTKPNPNRVITPTAVISVRGTTFEIDVDEDETTVIEVEEGSVEVQHALLPTGQRRILTAGESLRVQRTEPIARGKWSTGDVFKAALRIAIDAAVIATRGTGSPGLGPIGTPGGGTVGDTAPPAGPPSAPPSAPPALPPAAPPSMP
jgi:hypothetical protein